MSRWVLITVASFFFYGWWSVQFLWLLILTGVFDFSLALLIFKSSSRSRRNFLLAFSLIFNLGVLISFKYSQFLMDSWASVYASVTNTALVSVRAPSFLAILPIGISFYTFESLSYVIDVYSKKLEPTKNIFHYFSFLAMFPRLIAGPIERPHNLLPQLAEPIDLKDDMTFEGLRLIVLGFFKKTVIADNLALLVNTAFSNINAYSGAYWWYVMVCFALQIYCDFSGYTDIARGLAKLMGFNFGLNFKEPYTSTSFREFWTRWHISLSTWFRDYVYFPLGGDRKGAVRSHVNLWTTMIVSGFWHGASWNFGIWGALHAFYMSVERLTHWPKRLEKSIAGRALATFIIFVLTIFAWIFFRAPTFAQAMQVLQKMFSLQNGVNGKHYDFLIWITVAMHFVSRYGLPERSRVLLGHPWAQYIWLALLGLAALALRGPSEQFIYFQF
ncbi:MAG: MBOAT family protein [Bdellovibrio sp.]|nr:MBOAT family protein [Bdellovibrio sp.]